MKLLLLRALAAVAGLFVRPARPGPPRRVLVIKPDHLGDLLLASPALRALREGLLEARVVGLVGPWARLIWQGNPDLDALTDLPFPGFDRAQARRRPLYPYWLLLRYGLRLRREGYDAAILLRDDHWWGAALAAVAGIPRRIGHAHPLCRPLLSEALPYDPRRHVTRQALDVVAALVGAPPAEGPPGVPPTSFAPSEAEQAWAAGWLAANLAPGERLVVIHPGTGGPAKHWPPTAWAAVADALAELPATRLLLTGGPGEEPLVAQLADLLARPPLTMAGRTGVGQLAALLARAALVLGVDSGPLHIAVSQGAPSLHLYGPSDHMRFGPWGDPARHIVLRAGLFCSPCGVFGACPRGTAGPECMAAITPELALASARLLLAEA